MRAALILALCAGCGHTGYRAPLTCPQRGGPQWTEVTSEHFIFRTDNWPSVARRAVADFEAAYDAFFRFAGLMIPVRERLRDKVEVYDFERSEDYEFITGRRVGGIFMDRGHEPGRVARIVMQGGLRVYALTLFQHEMTHTLVRQSLPAAPLWLNEGLAEYLETLIVDGDRVVVGRSNRGFSSSWANVARFVIPVDRLPSVAQLFKASATVFYDESEAQYNYAAAWALVHYLRHADGQSARFVRYIKTLAAGTPAEKAWNEAFAGVDLAVIDREFREHAAERMLANFVAPYKAVALPALNERRMSDSEVHLMFLTLRPWTRHNNLAVGRELADAEAHGPASSDLDYWKGIFAGWDRGAAAAEAPLRAALEAAPSSRKCLLALLDALYVMEKRKPTAERKLDQLKPLLKRLWAHSGDPGIANEIAWIYAEMGQPDLGLPFARLAVEKEPGSAAFLDTQARLLADTGFVDEALELQRRAVAAVSDGKPPAELINRLHKYEKAVSEATK